jgi:hypothetical protein
MSTSMNETTTSSGTVGMGHNEGPDFDALELRADALATRAWKDYETGKKAEGTATQRYTAAIMLHHKAIDFGTPLRNGLQRPNGQRGKAWEALLAMVVEKFHPGKQPAAKNDAGVTNDIADWKNKRALVTSALQLACILDKFTMDVETYFDDRAGLFRIDPQYMCKDGYRPHEPGKLLHLNGRKFIALEKNGSGIQKPNLSASQLIKTYDPIPRAAPKQDSSAKNDGKPVAAPGTKGANDRNDKVVRDTFDDCLPALKRLMVDDKGQPAFMPDKIGTGTGKNDMSQAQVNDLSEIVRVGRMILRKLGHKLPF